MDHLPTHLRRVWSRVVSDVVAHRTPWDVADEVERVCAKVLREEDLRWVPVLARALDQSWRTGSSAAVEAAIVQIGMPTRTGVGACFVGAARVLAAQGVSPLGDVPDALGALVRSGTQRIPNQLCFAYLEPSLANDSFDSRYDYRQYVGEVVAQTRLEAMVRVIVRDGSSAKVRAPNRRRNARATEALMDVSVDSL